MHWYYEDKGKPAGPVPEHALRDLALRGAISPDTLVWREGMGDWQPLRTAAPEILTEPAPEGEQGPVPPPVPEAWVQPLGTGRRASVLPRPQVVFWYRMFCWFMVFLQVVTIIGGVIFFVLADPIAAESSGQFESMELRIQGGVFIVAGVVLLAPYFLGAFLPFRRWTWVFGLVLMALSLMSCCLLLPATIFLLIAWVKPETRAWFDSLQEPSPGKG
ncbi:MAG TPA: DUF4339 domain-containing protein [Verrucomicrobiales bacterium]|nr:DUF4339 domain-containing protein [Verrucomicrobiales bacterium]